MLKNNEYVDWEYKSIIIIFKRQNSEFKVSLSYLKLAIKRETIGHSAVTGIPRSPLFHAQEN